MRQRIGDAYHHPAAWPDEVLLEACEQAHGRSSGPGGQHRNKVSTLVTLVHSATGVSAQAGERRSMIENRGVALRRLRLALATEHREGVPDGPIGSALLRSRRTKLKRQRSKSPVKDPVFESLGISLNERAEPPRYGLTISPKHHDYPALLAEVMDVLGTSSWKPKDAAVRLNVSASQLVRLVRHHPAALARVNQEREAAGLRSLK
jgi:hypothetical protein